MALIDHVFRCNSYHLGDYYPLALENGVILGWVRASQVGALTAYPDVFEVTDVAVLLRSQLSSAAERSAAMAVVAQDLVDRGVIPKPLRNELYAVKALWMGEEFFHLDRQAVPFFGVKAYGVHVNGWVQGAEGPSLWIGRRAKDKAVEPGKLDNMVAGGQPAGLSLQENVIKEAAEEAGVPRALAILARPVGAITYCMDRGAGLKPDTLFCYDLEVPGDFVPENTDGEMESFELWPIQKALQTARDGTEFKFNVALVIIDFALRHGILTPDTEPAYEALVAGLHCPHPH